jgi:MFS family permease
MAEQGSDNPKTDASVAELAEKGKRAGIGAGMFGGAGLVGLYAVGALIAAAILALATAVDDWLAGLIVGLVLAAVVGSLPCSGRARSRRPLRPSPRGDQQL